MIDISAVRTQHSRRDIEQVVSYAKRYHFINVHALPVWVRLLSEMLADSPDIYVGAPVGFPSGGHKTAVKLLEAEQLIADGVQEMDIVMNVGKFKDRAYGYVQRELEQVIALAGDTVLTKVILEINVLDDAEMLDACRLVMDTGASFVKTGTGWVPGGANIDRIRKIKELCGARIKVKAAGGIRTPDDFLALADMGVERMGINTKSAIEIVTALQTPPGTR